MDKREEQNQVILAFDFGLKNIGLAVGQTITRSATPIKSIRAQKGVPNWREIETVKNDWKADAFVVGMPYNTDGTEQPITQCAKKFGESLKAKFHVPVYFMDERLTTKEARWILYKAGKKNNLIDKKQTDIDSLAAKVILESFLRLKNKGESRE